MFGCLIFESLYFFDCPHTFLSSNVVRIHFNSLSKVFLATFNVSLGYIEISFQNEIPWDAIECIENLLRVSLSLFNIVILNEILHIIKLKLLRFQTVSLNQLLSLKGSLTEVVWLYRIVNSFQNLIDLHQHLNVFLKPFLCWNCLHIMLKECFCFLYMS